MNNLGPNPVTSCTILSYAVCDGGVYPDSYSLHPNPPPQKSYSQDTDFSHPLQPYSAAERTWLNREVDLPNTQRKRMVIDFQDIADSILRLAIVPS